MHKKKEKIIFVFSDPGGAKPILSIAEEIDAKDYIIISDRYYSFYNDFKVEVTILDSEYELLINSYKPDIIFTATSYTSDIEKKFLKIASLNNIKTISFVDHWTSIIERFQYQNKIYLPDVLQVIDSRAEKIAIDQGVPFDRIEIVGNPYHRKIRNWKPTQSKISFLEEIGVKGNQSKILVYAPDPLSNVNGRESFGFDEIMATQKLVELFRNSSITNWMVLVKLHPNQNIPLIRDIIVNETAFFLVPENISNNTSIYYADVVVGFFSSFLLEANILNKTICRYLPFGIKQDPIKELNIGKIVDDDKLKLLLVTK
jgi:hypothetical protein